MRKAPLPGEPAFRPRPGRLERLRRRIIRFWRVLRARLGAPKYLCDSCRFDYRDACRRPERPNAIDCPDYRPRR